jgi:hypothetical protein
MERPADDVKTVFEELAVEQCLLDRGNTWTSCSGILTGPKPNRKSKSLNCPRRKAQWNALLESNVDEWIKQAKAAGLPAEDIVDDLKASIATFSLK